MISSDPQRLITRTRFQSPEGLIYRIAESAVVPGKTTKNGVDTPGSIEVTVFADEAGDKYNIKKTDFTIPGFKSDASRFKNIYARSSTDMTGGFVGKMKTILPADKATAIAKARHMEMESKYIQAEGVCMGDDAIKVCAGAMISITIEKSSRFSGNYLVTQARHDIVGGQYTVWFNASGNAPETLLSLVQASDAQYSAKINGVVVAIVTDVADPDKIGRVKVKYPWLAKDGADIQSDWARVGAVGAGKKYGIAFIPKVGDESL